MTGSSDGTFSFSPRGKVLLAYVLIQSPWTFTNFLYVTAEELRALDGVACRETSGPEFLVGSLSGIPSDSRASVYVGMRGFGSFLTADGTYGATNIPDGPIDVVAARAPNAAPTSCTEFISDRVIVQRDLNVNNSFPPLSFVDHGVAPVSSALTLSGLSDAEQLRYTLGLTTRTTHAFFSMACRQGPTTASYQTLPAAALRPDDFYTLSAGTPLFTATRTTTVYFTLASPRALAFGPAAAAATGELLASTPLVRYRVQIGRQAEYADYVSASFAQQAGSSNPRRGATVLVSAGHVGAGASWELVIPDMSDAPGWSNVWGLFDRPAECNVTVHRGRWSVARWGVRPSEDEIAQSATTGCSP